MIFTDALKGENFSGRPPVWIMRQAGRYMPQYRAIREKHSILELFRTPEKIAEVTRLPIDLLGMDAAILFSDILIVFDALGIEWDVIPGKGPVVQEGRLERRPVEEALGFVMAGIEMIDVDVPLIGFCGGPFTIASYLVEGGSSRDFKKIKKMMYTDPDHLEGLLDQICDVAIEFLQAQVRAGVDAVQVFDSWAHALTPEAFERFSLKYMQRIVDAVDAPVILFSKGYPEKMASAGPAGIGLSWQHSLSEMRQKTTCTLQGNLDPCILFGSPQTIEQEVDRILDEMRDDPGFIFNLGHGVLPDTPFESVQLLVDRVKQACYT